EGFELLVVFFGLTREAHDERRPQHDARDDGARLLDELEENLRSAATLHALEHGWTGMLERDVEVLRDIVVACDGLQQPRGDLVGIGVEETQPAQARQRCEGFEELGQAVFDAEVFAVAGCILADQGNLPDTLGDKVFGLGDDRRDATRTTLAAKLRDDAKATGMVAAFSDLDVSAGAGSRKNARCGVAVEILGQRGGGSVPGGAGEAALLLAEVALGAAGKM